MRCIFSKSLPFFAAALFSSICLLCISQAGLCSGWHSFTPALYQQEQAFHEAGLRGDHSQVPAMIQSLQTEQNPEMRKSVLLALAQLGATEALPVIDNVIRISFTKGSDLPPDVFNIPDVGTFAQAARARLVGEAAVQGMPDGKEKAQAKVERFFRELGKSPAEVNANATVFHKKLLAGTVSSASTPVEAYALQELADIVWLGNYADYVDLPQVHQIDFKQDGLASPKMQLSLLSPDIQRSSLIDMLAKGSGGTPQQQLLLNLGRDEAAQAVANKLQEMNGSQSKFKTNGFRLLLEVLQASGDTSHADLWARFEADNDLKIFATNIHDGKFKRDGVNNFVSGY